MQYLWILHPELRIYKSVVFSEVVLSQLHIHWGWEHATQTMDVGQTEKDWMWVQERKKVICDYKWIKKILNLSLNWAHQVNYKPNLKYWIYCLITIQYIECAEAEEWRWTAGI